MRSRGFVSLCSLNRKLCDQVTKISVRSLGSGPDQILPAVDHRAWSPDTPVTIRMTETGETQYLSVRNCFNTLDDARATKQEANILANLASTNHRESSKSESSRDERWKTLELFSILGGCQNSLQSFHIPGSGTIPHSFCPGLS